MGIFDSVDVQYLRRFWYEVYCAARGVELNMLSSERTVGEYYVAYESSGKKFLTPFSGQGNQRQFAASLQQDPSVKNVKLALIGQVSAADLIRSIRDAGNV